MRYDSRKHAHGVDGAALHDDEQYRQYYLYSQSRCYSSAIREAPPRDCHYRVRRAFRGGDNKDSGCKRGELYLPVE